MMLQSFVTRLSAWGGSAINTNIPVAAILFTVITLLACAPASGGRAPVVDEAPPGFPLQGGEEGQSAPAVIRGRVTLPGQTNAPDAAIEAAQVPEEVTAEIVAQGLEVPWELAFTPDGRILVTERPGRIRVIQDGALQEEPFATLEQVVSVSESGLMGMVLHPDFASNGHLFVCYTYRNESGDLRNRVARLTDVNGVGADHRVILDNILGDSRHDGCRLGFGPDGKLYVTMGDTTKSEAAQDLDSLSGKVLRLEADGSVPADNPFPNSYVYTYGHRNPQGMDWHPETGDLFITEHGPDEDDEINILRPGGNYGWPEVTGEAQDPRFIDPVLTFARIIAPAGAAFYSGDKLAASWDGNFIAAALRGTHLQRIVLEAPEFRTVLSNQRLFEGEFGRLRAVALSPDGYLYFTTSNRDGRGSPQPGDDKVLRLVPAPAEPPARFHPDANGNFALELEPGTYRIRWEAAGLRAVEQRIVVTEGENLDLGEIQLLGWR
jgi:glucose/arabinose dehydrogenase